MVGEMFHIKGTVFRMLPNPTVFYWDPSSFSLSALMTAYITCLRSLHENTLKDSEQISRILKWAQSDEKFPLLRTEGSTLDVFGEDINGVNLVNHLNNLRAGVELCDEYFGRMKKPGLSMIKRVVRMHIQEVMGILHEKNETDDNTKKDGTDEAFDDAPITIHDIDSASGEDKETLLIQMYFDRVRQNVVRNIGKQGLLSKRVKARQDSFASEDEISTSRPKPVGRFGDNEVNEAWCILLFRMLCWLQLHDFHKMDIQISKSDAYASRIPVYIV
jgi:hypothetical protein